MKSPLFTYFALPSKGVKTSPYGPRWGKFHAGIDMSAGLGSPIYAVMGGIVVTAQGGCVAGATRCHHGVGNYLAIDHQNGYYTCYYHLQEIQVAVGDRVAKGQVIATEGNTGHSFGSHLHFELRTNLLYARKAGSIDPEPYIDQKQGLPAPILAQTKNWSVIMASAILAISGTHIAYKIYQKRKLKKHR